MTSKIVVNNIEADAGISTITFINEVTAPTFNGNIVGTAATFSGNVDIAGALTYEDVTNVDSVGIITARSGLHVTGGSVGIGNSGDFGFFTNANDRTLILGTGNGSGAIQVHSGGTSYGGLYFGDSTSGNARYSGYVEYKHDENFLRFATAEEEKLRITSGGDVGIGTAIPVAAANYSSLSLVNTAGAQIELKRTSNNTTHYIYTDGSDNLNIGANYSGASTGDLVLRVGGSTERARLTSAGNLGIGTDNPATMLEVGNQSKTLAGAITVSNGEIIGGGTGPAISLKHGPAGGTQRTHQIYSYIGDLRIVADSNENMELWTGGSESLRINSAGNVTIGGKVDPAWHSTVDALTVGYAGVFYEDSYSVGGVAGRDNYLIIGNNTRYASDGQNKYINNDEAMRIYMHAGTLAYQNAAAGSGGNNITFTDRLHITPTGNMRIGDSSVTFSDNNAYYSNAWSSTDGHNTFLTIASTEYANIRFRGNHSTDAEFTIGVGNGTYYMAYDEIGNTHLLTASASTGVVSGDLNDTSDEKLKENITSIADGQIDIIKQLRPVNFDWKKGTLKGQSGFIAQEIKAVIPNLVQGEEYVEDDFGSVGYSVNTNGLVSHLTKALQEAISKIEALENRLTDAGL